MGFRQTILPWSIWGRELCRFCLLSFRLHICAFYFFTTSPISITFFLYLSRATILFSASRLLLPLPAFSLKFGLLTIPFFFFFPLHLPRFFTLRLCRHSTLPPPRPTHHVQPLLPSFRLSSFSYSRPNALTSAQTARLPSRSLLPRCTHTARQTLPISLSIRYVQTFRQ